MSANLDLVRSIYAAHERGDFSSVEWAQPEIEYVVADGPEPGTWSGRSGLAEVARGLLNAWEGYRAEAEEYRELDDERVLVLIRRSGAAREAELTWGRSRRKGRCSTTCATARWPERSCTGTATAPSPTSASRRRATRRDRLTRTDTRSLEWDAFERRPRIMSRLLNVT